MHTKPITGSTPGSTDVQSEPVKQAQPEPMETLVAENAQRSFQGDNSLQIAMPLGGIGAGCVCLNGQGGLQDFSIHHRPSMTAQPDGHGPAPDAAFALLHIRGLGITRLVEGPMPAGRIYAQGLKAQGYRASGHEGLPRFRNCTFTGEYPFGFVSLSDPDLPLDVNIRGFNPFIPLDDVSSGLPCAILEYTLANHSLQEVEYEFSYHLSHLAPGKEPWESSTSRNSVISGLGVYFWNTENPLDQSYGSAALGVIGHAPQVKAMWFRGGWFDAISALWREISDGAFRPNSGENAATSRGRNGGSILLRGSLAPGEEITYPIVIAWHFPNVFDTVGGIPKENENGACCSGSGCGEGQVCPPAWRPFYVSQWQDARQVLEWVRDHYASLRQRTEDFHAALFRSTLPSYVLDAVSANLAILKSPTVLRQENGNVWAWEGCFCDRGCCHGSCTHVWNYAQAMPHLFPHLERTLREAELGRSMDERGHVTFRSALPDGPTRHDFHAASDGQLGGIMKVYREWQISGRQDWLAAMYPLAKRSMDFCIQNWDPEHAGLLSEPHHNTYDIEFWGPDGMCSSFYLGALAATAAMARDAGRPQDAAFYEELAARGASAMDEVLFNGEYYAQKVMVEGLRASPGPEYLEGLRETNPEEARRFAAEGPKYQYASGCISDGVFGACLAHLCGLESPQTPDHVRKNLAAIFAYNFKPSLWEHANPQRPGYAIGDEPGLLLCTWPQGGKPTLPFVYSDEVWTGIEYQVAAHLIAQGFVAEGLTIVKAVRQRYDGRARNPWNEYECGSYYARAMASYALLITLSGFRYSAPQKALHVHPKLERDPFECFFSTASGWGTLLIAGDQLTLRLSEGRLEVDRLYYTRQGQTLALEPKVIAQAGQPAVIRLEG